LIVRNRDEVIDFVNRWAEKTELPASRFVGWLGISSSKFYNWKTRYGKVNEHNAWIPRDHWLDDWEKKAILDFESQHPLKPHEHWHIDVSYINISGTFYYMASLLDGYSRAIVHFEIHESMTEPQIELLIQRAREKYPEVKPRIISDNGPQFIANDFKQFIRICGMTHVKTFR
jgi:transposase InsO family protein